jgi:hypothetical protein
VHLQNTSENGKKDSCACKRDVPGRDVVELVAIKVLRETMILVRHGKPCQAVTDFERVPHAQRITSSY